MNTFIQLLPFFFWFRVGLFFWFVGVGSIFVFSVALWVACFFQPYLPYPSFSVPISGTHTFSPVFCTRPFFFSFCRSRTTSLSFGSPPFLCMYFSGSPLQMPHFSCLFFHSVFFCFSKLAFYAALVKMFLSFFPSSLFYGRRL